MSSPRSIGAPTAGISPSAAYDGSLHVLDADDDGRPTLVGSEPEPHVIQALAFAPDGRTIATATFNQPQPDTMHVSIWDWRAGKVVRELDAVGASSLAFDGSGERLAIGFFDGNVEIRDASTCEVERSFGAGSVTVMNVVFSPDGEDARDRRGGCDDPPLRHPRRDRRATAACSEATSSSSRAWTSARTGSGWHPLPPTVSCACGRSTSTS